MGFRCDGTGLFHRRNCSVSIAVVFSSTSMNLHRNSYVATSCSILRFVGRIWRKKRTTTRMAVAGMDRLMAGDTFAT
jgi:hypothetical protein